MLPAPFILLAENVFATVPVEYLHEGVAYRILIRVPAERSNFADAIPVKINNLNRRSVAPEVPYLLVSVPIPAEEYSDSAWAPTGVETKISGTPSLLMSLTSMLKTLNSRKSSSSWYLGRNHRGTISRGLALAERYESVNATPLHRIFPSGSPASLAHPFWTVPPGSVRPRAHLPPWKDWCEQGWAAAQSVLAHLIELISLGQAECDGPLTIDGRYRRPLAKPLKSV